jgi:GntR family transcriptional regulator
VTVDRTSPEWPRKQVADRIRQRIADGELGPRLPSFAALAEEMGVSAMTVQKALAVLKDEGLVYSVPGLGTFVV